MKMLSSLREDTFMEKFAGLFTVITLACGMAFAQAGSHSAGTAAVTIQQWHGTLVDAGCAGSSNAKTADAASAPAEQTQPVDKGRPQKAHAKTESPASGCAVTSSTSAFALQAVGGQVMKFDSVGNIRAAEMLKSKANWTKDLSAGKPIHAKVSGTLSGETVTVASLE
jgi:hypothetical protein